VNASFEVVVARYTPKDRFFQQAKAQGLRARSAFKLDELVQRLGLRSLRGKTVVDLGAAPGGWLQVLARLVGPEGRVIGLDLVAIAPVASNVATHAVDMRDPAALAGLALPAQVDLVTSDMAPKTTGIHATDVARSLELVRLAFDFTRARLRPGGTFITKVFMGQGLQELERDLKAAFLELRHIRPEATREGSREIYLAGKGLRSPVD
jgi:23S rRNA (uridine2552-2'-O)-methyltransferase